MIDGRAFLVELKTINQVTVDSSNYEDPVSIQVLDLIFTQSFNYS